MSDTKLESLLAQQQIRDVLYHYCRALDRMDKALAYSVWHADGTALYHDMYEGTGRGFVDWVWDAHAAMERHSHQVTNSIIRVDGTRAVSEAYVTVALWTAVDAQGEQQEIIGRGRYLDQWSQRAGRWAIDQREHVLDMQSISPLNPGYVNAASRRDTNDPSFGLLGQQQ